MILLELKEAYDRKINERVSHRDLTQNYTIRYLIDVLGMKQVEFGEALGLKKRTQINSYIRVKSPLSLVLARKIQAIAKAHGVHVSLNDLFACEGVHSEKIMLAKRCQRLARERGVEITLDEIFDHDDDHDEGEDDGS
jgi:hypothetical protein